jgi:hypothetical protein
LISSGLVYPGALAVDCAGNVYINDGVILKFVAANNTVVKLVPQSQNPPGGIAVDGSGNVYFNYIAPQGGAVDTYVWTMAASNVTTVASLSASRYDVPAVAVDAARNLFISDSVQGVIDELPCVFVDPTPISESAAAGDDVLPTVLPVTANLLAPFAPGSDQSWLAITGITNGVASFSFAANTGPARTAHITLLGQSIPITQEGAPTPPLLTGVVLLSNGVIQFGFTNNSTASFTVLTTTNLSWPLSEWSVAGTPINTAPGIFQFTSQPTTNDAQRFYCVPSQQQSCEFIHRVRSSGKPRNGCCRM